MEGVKEEPEPDVTAKDLVYHLEDDAVDTDVETTKLLHDDNSSIGQNNNKSVDEDELVVYKRRWLMLFIFSLNTAMSGCFFISLSPLNDIVRKYYDVRPVAIEWLSNMCFVAYVIFSLPATFLIARWGVRPLLFGIAGFNLLASAVHFAGYARDRFYLVVIGQGFVSLAFSTVLQIPGKLSSLWFPVHERATATSIATMANMMGVAIGFMHPTLMVHTDPEKIESEIKMFFMSQFGVNAVIVALTCFFQEKPPTPPCPASHRETLTFIESLRLLWRNKHFIFLSQSFAIYFGLFNTAMVLLNPLVTPKYQVGYETSIGWMGFWNIVISIVSFVVIGRLVDMFHKYQLTAIALNLSSMILWLVFVVVLHYTHSFTAVYILFVTLGVCFLPYFAVGIEQAAEMTYPVSEETSSNVILLFGNLYGFIFIIAFGELAQLKYARVTGYLMTGLYLVSTLMAAIAKTDLKRMASEEKNTP